MADHHELPLGPQDLGDKLEDLLDRLAASGLATSPRDRINATRLGAALIARGKVLELRDLKPHLAVLLARSPAERNRFMILFDGVEPPKKKDVIPNGDKDKKKKEVWNPLAALINSWERVRPMLPRAAMVAALIAATAFAWIYWNSEPQQPAGDTGDPIGRAERQFPKGTEAAPEIKLPDDASLKRIATAAERFEGAPTIDELAEELAKGSPIVWPAPSYAIRLNELSGLPRTVPLALYGARGKDGQIWARLGLALERIERPGREPAFAALREMAKASLDGAAKPLPVYALAAKLQDWYGASANFPKDVEAVADIQQRDFKDRTGEDRKPAPGEALDPHTIARALAIAGPAFAKRTGSDAPWLPRHTAVAASLAPWWAPWLAVSLPVVLGTLWAFRSLALRRAYLRRRPPDLPPLHTKLVSRAPSLARYDAAKFQGIARRLRTRTARSTARLDVDASIAATLRAGGELPSPIYAVERHNPEYLVLIERRSARDQEAERLRTLVRRLESMLSATVFYYRTGPSRLEPEGGGRALSIEQLESLYPEHRLVILGSGAGFLDPATLKPLPSVERLAVWSRRALLTPLGVAEWGSEELELSRELKMPIGRATLEGMEALSEMLGLEGAELQSLTEDRGDNLARPLPLDMRSRPERYLYNRPPPGEPAEEIVRQLRNYLDGRAFEWLAALAIYPALQWDLTLYLGVTLPETPGGGKNADGTPKKAFDVLYSEDRLAALTQLPWLREGIMPNWLRSALIAELSEERRDEVRRALTEMIGKARIGEPGDDEATIKTTIARERERIDKEPQKDSLPPNRLMEDQVLLDFLAEGRQEDLEITGASWLDHDVVKSWVKRLGVPGAATIGVAIAYGAAALFISPKVGDGALVAGAWLPLILLGAGALLTLAFADREPAYALLRKCLGCAGRISLAYVLIVVAIGAASLTPLLVLDGRGLVARGMSLGLSYAISHLVALAAVYMARQMASRMGIAERTQRGWFTTFLLLNVEALLIWLLLGLVFESSLSAKPLNFARTLAWSAVLFAVPVFVAWLAARLLPEKLPQPKLSARGQQLTTSLVVRRMSLAMAPIVPAVLLAFFVASSSTMLKEQIPGGVTATAELPSAHLVALGGADGSIRIVDMSSGSAELIATLGGSDHAVASLSFGPQAGSASRELWASYADGSMIHFESQGSNKYEANGFASDFAGSPSRVLTAHDAGGILLTARETADGAVKLAADGGGELEIPNSGPVTALIAAGDGRFAAATLDGSIYLAEANQGSAPLLTAETKGKNKLPGRARRLTYDIASNLVTAYGDDGTVLQLPATPEDFAGGTAVRNIVTDLNLGAAIPFDRQVKPPGELKRIALVVGNSSYEGPFALANTANDARAAAKALYALGFEVAERINLKRDGFRDELSKFRERARTADVALFYFAGHAYANGGQNRMVPIDVGGTRADAPNAITEAEIIAAVAPARALKAIIIDSHDNKQLPKDPAEAEGTRGLGGDGTDEPDLPATRTLPIGTVVMYAAGEGTIAYDQIPGGSRNSPFTTALVNRLGDPGGPVLDLFEAITTDVRASTNDKQKPVIYANLSGPISISGRIISDQPSVAPQDENATNDPSALTPQDDLAFAYYPPGDLAGGARGVTDRKVYLPDIIFPLKVEKGQHAFMNSQIFGRGGAGWGGKGALGGSESDPRNYNAMRLRDNYCEPREFAMPLCPSGKGHQGQDIRPPSFKDNFWEVLAVADGTITQVTSSSSLTLTTPAGSKIMYLQMDPQSITVKEGQQVRQGEVIGRVSNYLGGKPKMTTLHLHFQVQQSIKIGDRTVSTYVPPYTSLIAAYRELKGLPRGIDASGNLIVDPDHEIGAGKIPRPPETAPAVAYEPTQTGPEEQTNEASQDAQPSLEDTTISLRTALLALDAAKVKEILDGGWDADTPLDGDGNAALHVLMEVCEKTPNHDRDALATLARNLIANGATPDIENKLKDTPLAIARSPRFCGTEHPVVTLLSELTERNFTQKDPTQPGPFIPPSLESLTGEYLTLFATAEIRPERLAVVRDYVDHIFKNRSRYEAVESATGVPWYFIGLIHGIEASFNFNAHLHNGDPLKVRTIHVPAGRPLVWNPPNDWTSSAIDYIQLWKFDQEKSWTVPEMLYRLEKQNGWRTRTLYKINTPYLWSYTQHYTKGKFVADNVWDPNAVSKQPGTAAQLKLLMADPRFNQPSQDTRGLIDRPALDTATPGGKSLPQANEPGSTRGLSPEPALPAFE